MEEIDLGEPIDAILWIHVSRLNTTLLVELKNRQCCIADDTANRRLGLLVPDRNGPWAEQVSLRVSIGSPLMREHLPGRDGMFQFSRLVSF